MDSVRFILLNLLIFNVEFIQTQNYMTSMDELGLTFDHTWDQRSDTVIIYFNISTRAFIEYRYYYFDFRPFGIQNTTEYFPRQRLVDTQNFLRIIGLHEADYVSCVSFVDEYENIFKPRYACYEFTIGEKTVGSHHGGSTGYLAPLLLAVAFVIHVIIVVVHHIKAKDYAHSLLQRFMDVNPKAPARSILNVKHSLKELDHPRISASVQRRLSRVSIDVDEDDKNNFPVKNSSDDLPIFVMTQHNRKHSLGVMQTILEQNP